MKRANYKQPRSFNSVSFLLLVLLAGAIYWGWRFGPAHLDHFRVKQLAHECASKFYKLRNLEKSLLGQESNKLVQATRKNIVAALGFDDPQMTVQLLINEETKQVQVVVEYNRTILLPGLNRSRVVHFVAVGQSDFEDVDW